METHIWLQRAGYKLCLAQINYKNNCQITCNVRHAPYSQLLTVVLYHIKVIDFRSFPLLPRQSSFVPSRWSNMCSNLHHQRYWYWWFRPKSEAFNYAMRNHPLAYLGLCPLPYLLQPSPGCTCAMGCAVGAARKTNSSAHLWFRTAGYYYVNQSICFA